jgi:hypothetical protein
MALVLTLTSKTDSFGPELSQGSIWQLGLSESFCQQGRVVCLEANL